MTSDSKIFEEKRSEDNIYDVGSVCGTINDLNPSNFNGFSNSSSIEHSLPYDENILKRIKSFIPVDNFDDSEDSSENSEDESDETDSDGDDEDEEEDEKEDEKEDEDEDSDEKEETTEPIFVFQNNNSPVFSPTSPTSPVYISPVPIYPTSPPLAYIPSPSPISPFPSPVEYPTFNTNFQDMKVEDISPVPSYTISPTSPTSSTSSNPFTSPYVYPVYSSQSSSFSPFEQSVSNFHNDEDEESTEDIDEDNSEDSISEEDGGIISEEDLDSFDEESSCETIDFVDLQDLSLSKFNTSSKHQSVKSPEPEINLVDFLKDDKIKTEGNISTLNDLINKGEIEYIKFKLRKKKCDFYSEKVREYFRENNNFIYNFWEYPSFIFVDRLRKTLNWDICCVCEKKDENFLFPTYFVLRSPYRSDATNTHFYLSIIGLHPPGFHLDEMHFKYGKGKRYEIIDFDYLSNTLNFQIELQMRILKEFSMISKPTLQLHVKKIISRLRKKGIICKYKQSSD